MNDENSKTSFEPERKKWERFEAGGAGPRQRQLRVSIDRRGLILLNPGVMRRLDNPRAVALYFDRANLAIGMEARPPDEPDTFRVTTRSRRGSGLVAGLAFFRFYRLVIPATLSADLVEIDDGMLTIDLAHMRKLRRPGNVAPGEDVSKQDDNAVVLVSVRGEV
ncbi:MAG: hypothetical protein ABI999_00900 [Acidobacteriota bacterium]